MSNILIIKHGSLGDIAQISGVLRDIKENNFEKKIFILTTDPYIDFLNKCPFVDTVLLDRRLPRWNFFYLIKLKKLIESYNFTCVYDLQNSSRTKFYRKFLLKIKNWNCSETTLPYGKTKKDYDQESVLERFEFQLTQGNIKTKYTLKPNLKWACENVDQIIKKYFVKKYILIFPFCSPQLSHKQWPYYNDLIKIIKSEHNDFEIGIVPGPKEIFQAQNFDAKIILNNDKSLNLIELTGLINKSYYIIANDTGPAHIAAHLGSCGITLFGHHTSPKKVSIETENFKAITSNNLKKLTPEKVYSIIKNELNSIN